ncbi:MAG TPA: hypothetical protein P5539_08950 [Mesotoga sp.]|nr:hypothetical protein [Mesotoga sp.]
MLKSREEIGKKVRAQMRMRGISEYDMFSITGIDPARLSEICFETAKNESKEPTAIELLQISSALGLKLEDIIK